MAIEEDIISRYTREEALRDGVLVDVTARAKPLGFKHHTAVTQRVWAECVAVPENVDHQAQDEDGRLHDLLFMASLVARARGQGTDRADFGVKVLTGPSRYEVKKLWLHCGPGDAGEAVVTIMMQGED